MDQKQLRFSRSVEGWSGDPLGGDFGRLLWSLGPTQEEQILIFPGAGAGWGAGC